MNRIAAIQMTSSHDVEANLIDAERLLTQAADEGAELVVLPENFAIMGRTDHDKVRIREQPGAGPIQDFLSVQARRHGLWLVGGTIPLACDNPDKVLAACMLYAPTGELKARYDKIHLFDVSIGEEKEVLYQESATIETGDQVVVADTPLGKLGLAVCYDLRFPEMFRHMLDQGMEIIAMPAAFTSATGRAHWDVLVRARAVENLCYMIAANQAGRLSTGRKTHGNSMIVNPWGKVIGHRSKGAGVIVAEMDREHLTSVRARFPAIKHRRFHS